VERQQIEKKNTKTKTLKVVQFIVIFRFEHNFVSNRLSSKL